MKTNIIYKVLLLTFSVFAFASCELEELNTDTNVSSAFEVTANLGTPSSRAILVQKENSLDYVSRWQGHEYVYAYCAKKEKFSKDRVESKIMDVAPNGSTGKFLIEPCESWKTDGKLAVSNDYYFFISTCHPVLNLEENKILLNASLKRCPINEFMIPAYSTDIYLENDMAEATFHHYYAYEILHVFNKTGEPINFSINDFAAGTRWYRSQGYYQLNCWRANEFVTSLEAEKPAIQSMTVEPYGSNIMVSAYVPNGQKIKDATLVATIDGNIVKTSNTLSSDANIEIGRAYHMYATWNGKELCFGEANVEPDDIVEEGYVDLDLPSGNLWAACNLGAEQTSQSGNYFAWAETTGYDEGKTSFSWSNYKHCKGSANTLTKYCSKSSYGRNGFTDQLTTIQGVDDPVSSCHGANYCVPTKADWDELIENCNWTKYNNGVIVSGKKKGNAIFLPCAGYRQGVNLYDEGSEGYYWTSSLDVNSPDDAWFVYIGDGKAKDYDYYRCTGRSIRPIMRGVPKSSAAKQKVPIKEQKVRPMEKAIGDGMVVKAMSGAAMK